MLVIDRLEEYMAIIEYNGHTYELPRYLLPDNVKEGDVIKITIDKIATKKRKKKIKKLSDDLFE